MSPCTLLMGMAAVWIAQLCATNLARVLLCRSQIHVSSVTAFFCASLYEAAYAVKRACLCHAVPMPMCTGPCVYSANAYSNKRWCCGDMDHFDVSSWAFEKVCSWILCGLR